MGPTLFIFAYLVTFTTGAVIPGPGPAPPAEVTQLGQGQTMNDLATLTALASAGSASGSDDNVMADALGDALGVVADAASGVGDAVAEVAGNVQDKMAEVAENVQEVLTEGAPSAHGAASVVDMGAVEDIVAPSTGGMPGDVSGGVVAPLEAVSSAVDDQMEAVSSAVDDQLEAVSSAIDDQQEATSEIVDTQADAISDVVEVLQDATSTGDDSASSAGDVSEAVEEVLEELQDGDDDDDEVLDLQDLVEGVQDQIADTTGSDAVLGSADSDDGASGAVNADDEFMDEMREMFGGDALVEAQDTANDMAEDIAEQLQGGDLGADSMAEDLQEAISEAVGGASVEVVDDSDNDLFSWLDDRLDNEIAGDDDEYDDGRKMSSFARKMSQMKQLMDMVEAQTAATQAAKSGTCPMYPVHVSTDKVTITTHTGCKIVIKLKGASVEGIHSIYDNMTDRTKLDRSVEVSYTSDN